MSVYQDDRCGFFGCILKRGHTGMHDTGSYKGTITLGLAVLGLTLAGCQPAVTPAPDSGDAALVIVEAGPPAPTPSPTPSPTKPPAPPPPPAPSPSPSPSPTPPPAPASACALACAALTLAGCPLGSDLACAAVLFRDLGSGKIDNPVTGMPLTCIDVKAVRTKADAISLGFTCQ